MANALANPLLEGTTGLSPDFSVNDIDFDALDGFTPGINHEENEFTALHTNHRGYIGDDGNIYRKEIRWNKQTEEFEREYTDERLYFWTPPQELGDAANDAAAQEAAMAGPKGFGAAGLYTKAEIQEAWDASEGMGYLKQHTTWDKYWNFVEQSTALFTDPEYDDITGGNMTTGNWQDSPEYMALLEEAGIPTQYINDDGDVFNFNGTTYVKDYKTDDSIGVEVINAAFLSIVGSAIAGPLLAGALTPALGAAGAKAASSAIMSLAKDAMLTGDLNFGDALVSAGTSYLGEQFSDLLGGVAGDAVGQAENSRLMEVIQGYVDAGYSQETIDKMYDVISSGVEAGAGSNAIIDALQDFVNTGVVEVVWDVIDSTDKEGEFDPDAPENPYDPELIDPQLPEIVDPNKPDGGGGGGGGGEKPDSDGDGIPDDEDEFPNDPTNGGGNNGGGGQYEVIRPGKDGTWVVRDNVDGDVWIVKGDYQVGDILSEGDMVDAVGDGGDLDGSDVNKDSDGDGIKDYIDRWPDIPNLPNVDPTVPGNQLPDGSTVPDPNAEVPGNNNDGNTDTDTDTETDNTGVNEGDSCTLADGSAGTIQNGVCTANNAGPSEGDACTMPDGSAGTIQGGVCQSNNAGPNEGDECTLADGSKGTIQGGVCKGNNGSGKGEDGDGDGEDGNNDGPGGDGLMAMAGGTGGDGRPTWGPRVPQIAFRKFNKRTGPLMQSLFEDLMG